MDFDSLRGNFGLGRNFHHKSVKQDGRLQLVLKVDLVLLTHFMVFAFFHDSLLKVPLRVEICRSSFGFQTLISKSRKCKVKALKSSPKSQMNPKYLMLYLMSDVSTVFSNMFSI